MGKRFLLLLSMLFVIAVFSGCSKGESAPSDVEQDHVIRIGYQKNGPLVILKSLGTLEEQLNSLGYTVEWKLFQEGPALVEALNAGSIDFGRTGNSPVIFAQAANTDFQIVAAGKSKFQGSGILVPKDSDIKSIANLKNKTVSFAKGSSSHYLLAKALEKSGLKYSDITPAFLSPGDARIAFEQGDVDAMVVWDPFTASTELFSDATLLVNGEGFTTDRDFFITTNEFAKEHQDLVDVVMEEVKKSSEWANNNHDELVSMLTPILNIEEEAMKKSVERRTYGVDPINEQIIKEQQEIADTFYRLNIIPKKINVADIMKK
ncbi:sulfonate ABC transporter substrate-binding protein [Lentibacillus daqui]|uniref:sulfonate ABC transporter substrate-binding protein n=1 Tax=Lentibacillus daqui TaxID=2911514 RepID=UPI0022B0E810|nr:sulfonate ABC transporter substrate-binding protein [Lentibacillus daqui]